MSAKRLQPLDDPRKAYLRSLYNRHTLEASHQAGCYLCGAIYPAEEVRAWQDEPFEAQISAICPRCGFTAVFGDAAGYAITPEFLEEQNGYWVERTKEENRARLCWLMMRNGLREVGEILTQLDRGFGEGHWGRIATIQKRVQLAWRHLPEDYRAKAPVLAAAMRQGSSLQTVWSRGLEEVEAALTA